MTNSLSADSLSAQLAQPLDAYLRLEHWAMLNEKLQFVPMMTEEFRDWAWRKSRVTGQIFIDGPRPIWKLGAK